MILCLDAETYFDDQYSLSRMTTEGYCRDQQFECHGWAAKWDANTPARWYTHDQAKEFFKTIDWANTYVLAHHCAFDGLILTHHYGINPKAWLDTLSCARLLLGNHLSVGLGALAKHFNLQDKNVPYNLFKGKHWNELAPDTQKLVGAGACHDVELTWRLFEILSKDMPREEFQVIDTTIRMFTNPVMVADTELLAQIWEEEDRKKTAGLKALAVTTAELQSADKFAALLRQEGVEPELKPGKKGDIYCFAKTDNFMRELLEHEDDRVRLLAETRLGVKSTLMQTRTETWGFMASRGPMCVYLNYAGAGTLRPSGGDGSNFLNMKRASKLRKALQAPEGYLLLPVDSSQIECRVLHYLAGGPDEPVVVKFRNHEDPYVDLAMRFYEEPIYKPKSGDPRKDEMEAKRGMGKQGRLMCGYGAAAKQFKQTAKNGLYGPSVDIPIEDAERFVSLYRSDNPSICARNTGYWARCDKLIARLAGGPPMDFGPLHVRDGRIYLPNGCPMIYDTMEFHRPTDEEKEKLNPYKWDGYWRVKTRHGWKEMWGSKLTQNICEAVSRVIVTQAMNRITAMGYRVLNHPYDELLCLIPKDGHEQEHRQRCIAEMVRPVDWLPGLPLDAEGELGERYSK